MSHARDKKDEPMYNWMCTVATIDGEKDVWIYTFRSKTLATVEKRDALWLYKVVGTKIEGMEKTRTGAMMRARQEYERHEDLR